MHSIPKSSLELKTSINIFNTKYQLFSDFLFRRMASAQDSLGQEDSTKPPPCTIHEQAEVVGGGVAGESFTVENVVSTSCDGDSQTENTDKAEEIEEAVGPSGLQAPVLVQQAVCGEDDPPSLCEYERLRERNIREREEAMKEAMEEIDEAKQDMRNNAPGVADKRKAVEDMGGKNKRRKKEVVQVRRSGRDRKPVTYTVDKDLDGRSRKRTRAAPVKNSTSTVVKRSTNARAQVSSTRTLRPRQPVDYAEIPEPEADGFIWCSTCGTEEYNGCEKHVTLFGDNKMFKLEIGPSAIKGVNVGQGVFNRGKFIPEGTLFGPYTGNFIPAAEYVEVEKAGMESGNAWEIRDKDNKKTVGFIDPGMKPDPKVHWMSKVNCACTASEQNLVGFQLAGQVYYRAIVGIRVGRELLVFYGETYARGLGIKMDKFEKYLGKEDQTKEAVRCDYCSSTMDGRSWLNTWGKGREVLTGAKQDRPQRWSRWLIMGRGRMSARSVERGLHPKIICSNMAQSTRNSSLSYARLLDVGRVTLMLVVCTFTRSHSMKG